MTAATAKKDYRRLIECLDCGKSRPNGGGGRCGTCYDRRRRGAAPLTDKQVASLRRMVGYRPEWSEPLPKGGTLSDGNARTRARIAARLSEHGWPATRLPDGALTRLKRELGITDGQMKWHLRELRRKAS
ncbi:hypothetical protein [Tsukamurella hominis]|uniref:hypothetical protein n=1 Tax=Tsukamurella hominis TaxID=1970232 RepID=UPI0039E829E4